MGNKGIGTIIGILLLGCVAGVGFSVGNIAIKSVSSNYQSFVEDEQRKKEAEEDLKIISFIIATTMIIGLPFALYSEKKQVEREIYGNKGTED